MNGNISLEQFLMALFSCIEGLIEIRTIHKNSGKVYLNLFTRDISKIVDEINRIKNECNVYFGISTRKRESGKKEDVLEVICFFADLDFKDYTGGEEEARKRIREFQFQPSIIVETGNGFHCYWLFKEPLKIEEDYIWFESINKGIAEYLGADRCWNIDRILRVPNTLNFPTKTKKKKGVHRIKEVKIIEFNEKRYEPSDFEDYRQKSIPIVRQAPIQAISFEAIQSKFEKDLTEDKELQKTWKGYRFDLKDQTRSGYDMAMANRLAGKGYSPEEIKAILVHSPSGKAKDATDAYLDHTIHKAFQSPALPQQKKETPKKIHLIDIEDASLINRQVEIDVRVVGVGDAYFAPKTIQTSCADPAQGDHDYCGGCPLANGIQKLDFGKENPILIETVGIKNRERLSIFTKLSNANCNRILIEEAESQTFTELIVYPKAQAIEVNQTGKLVDDRGREFRKKKIFFAGRKQSSCQSYKITGKVFANPKSQISTLVAGEMLPLEEIPEGKQTSLSFDELDEIISQLPAITKIQGRPDAHEAALLTYTSPLKFEFEEKQVKGTIDVAFMGGTRLGKSEIARSLSKAIGLGVYATGEASTRAGLLYGIENLSSGHIISWGLLPQNDGKLLIIDGVNCLSPEDWRAMREARTQGVVSVNRIVSGEHPPCQTRLILIGNTDKPVSCYRRPVEALSESQLEGPDIARLDLVFLFGEEDVPPEIINSTVEGEKPALTAIKGNIGYAWRVNPQKINFTTEAITTIYTSATHLAQVFGGIGSHEVPLISNDVKVKLARLAASCALLCGTCKVEKCHVDRVVGLKERSLRKMKLDRFVQEQREQLTGGENEKVQEVVAWIQEIESNPLKETLKIFEKYPVKKFGELLALVGIARSTLTDKLKELMSKGLLTNSSKGYQRTQLLIAAQKKLETEPIGLTEPNSSVPPKNSEENENDQNKGGIFQESPNSSISPVELVKPEEVEEDGGVYDEI